MPEEIKRSADFSECRTWRYTLLREWDKTKPHLLMVLLNPSTADENHDDATNRRGMRYAKDWGYGSLCFCNLFAFRTPDPKVMKAAKDPIGPDNDLWIGVQANIAKTIVVGWGNHGTFKNRAAQVMSLLNFRQVYCLAINKGGEPKHPLYCKADLGLLPYGGLR